MSYLRAEDILPKELIDTIQQYISGKTIYIPSKEKRLWGSGTDTRQTLSRRNREIFENFHNGVSVKALAEAYSLSEKSIQRIIRNIKASEKCGDHEADKQ